MQPKAGQIYCLVHYKVHSFGESTKVSAPWTAIHLSVMKWSIPNVKAFGVKRCVSIHSGDFLLYDHFCYFLNNEYTVYYLTVAIHKSCIFTASVF